MLSYSLAYDSNAGWALSAIDTLHNALRAGNRRGNIVPALVIVCQESAPLAGLEFDWMVSFMVLSIHTSDLSPDKAGHWKRRRDCRIPSLCIQ